MKTTQTFFGRMLDQIQDQLIGDLMWQDYVAGFVNELVNVVYRETHLNMIDFHPSERTILKELV